MNILVSDQLYIFAWAIIFGGLLGLFYDTIRVFRRILPHEKLAIGIEDMIFWLLAAIIIFGYIFNTNDGVMRGFIFIGLSLGVAIYMLLFSRVFIEYTTKLIKTIINGIKTILMWLFKPIKILVKPLGIFAHKTSKCLKKSEKWLIIRIRQFLKEIRFIMNKI